MLAIYLHHRKSDDLDFFTYNKNLYSIHDILQYIKYFGKVEITNQSSEQIDLLIDGTKVTFFDAGWEFLKPRKIKQLNIATIESIAAMKIHVLFLRAKYRDYYDVYFLMKELGIKKLYDISSKIIPGLTMKLFSMALLYVDDIIDDKINHLEPVISITKYQIRDYIQQQIKELDVT